MSVKKLQLFDNRGGSFTPNRLRIPVLGTPDNLETAVTMPLLILAGTAEMKRFRMLGFRIPGVISRINPQKSQAVSWVISFHGFLFSFHNHFLLGRKKLPF